MTKTDTLRGRFEQARQKWIEAEYGYGRNLVPKVFLDSFDSGYKAAQPTEAEIEELERKWAQAIEGILLRRIYEKRVEGYTLETGQEMAAAVVSLLRGKLGGTGR